MTPEDKLSPILLSAFLDKHGLKLIINADLTLGIEGKTGWGDAQFGRRVREILNFHSANIDIWSEIEREVVIQKIIDESLKP